MATRFEFSGRTAVITGAGSGIGAALAKALAERGCNLALVDINPGALVRTEEQASEHNVSVSSHALDIADPQAPAELARRVQDRHGGAQLLFNNAGIAMGGTFDQVRQEDFDKVLAVNFEGVVRMTRAFLPVLQAAPMAQIVNISSIFGIIAPPGQTAYCASKFAVRGFSMALAHELVNTTVGVSVVHPGGVATRIAEDAIKPPGATDAQIDEALTRARAALVMPPPRAADIILRGVARRKRRILVGRDAHILMWIERLFPTGYIKLIRRRLG